MMQKHNIPDAGQGFVLPDLCEYQSVFILLLAAQLLVVAFIVFQFGLRFDWAYFGLVTLYVQWQAMMSAVVLCKLRGYLQRLAKIQAVTLAYTVLLLIALVLGFLVQWQYARLTGFFDTHFVLRNVLLSAIVIGIALRYLYVQQQSIERERSTLQASLSALQARMRPHFLFNTMNSIASLISIAPEKAEQMVEDLAELLRASLREDVLQSSIAEEWQLCERYLAIEQLRLGERLRWSCDFSALETSQPIPALSLQPLVENAIYHGIQPSALPGFIEVCGQMQGDLIKIAVRNSKPPASATQGRHQGNQMAVSNIRQRLQQLYGDSARLELQDQGDIFQVSLLYNPIAREKV